MQAVAELQCSGVTLFPNLLAESANTKEDSLPIPVPRGEYSYLNLGPTPDRLRALSQSDPLASQSCATPFDLARTDYIKLNGKALDEAIRGDEICKERLAYAIDFFIEAEDRARMVIEGLMKE